MKLKPLKWCVTGRFARATTDIFFELEAGRCLNSKLHRWSVGVDETVTLTSGLSETLEQAIDEAEAAYLKLLLDQLETEHEAMAASRTGLDRDRGDTWGSD